MWHTRRPLVAATLVAAGLLAVTTCGGTTAANGPSTTAKVASLSTQPTPGGTPTGPITGPVTGSVTPTGPVHLGDWMMTVHGAQAYPQSWNAPGGMPGPAGMPGMRWGNMGSGHMAVVLDVSAQYLATPAPGPGTAYAGPRCGFQGGMMGPRMGGGAYGWHQMAPGVYRGPMAFMAHTSVRQFTLLCADPATGNQASWHIGF